MNIQPRCRVDRFRLCLLRDLVQLCGHSSPTSECAGNVSPNQLLNLARLFPLYAAFPRSEYYRRAPTSTVASISLRMDHSVDILGPLLPGQDGGESPRCHDASISAHAVLSDPAGVSSDHRLLRSPTVAFQISTLSASGFVTRLNRFTCVTAWTSLCLRLTHVVTSMSPRLDSQWGGSSPFRGGNFTR